jgi:hypothetical protein
VIIYDFSCTLGHRFEGWFASADDCESQLGRGLLRCPHCDSAEVTRVPSAAHVHTGSAAAPAARRPTAAPDTGSAAGPSAAQAAAAVEKLREWVAAAEDVGAGFADEARRIHQQEAPERAIRGVTTREQARALRDEGIPVLDVPPHLVNKVH